MRNLLIIIFTAYSVSVFSQRVTVTDYQVPLSTAETLRFDGSWNWAQTGENVTANNADANLTFRSFYTTLPLAWFLNIDATGGKDYSDFNHNIQFDGSFRKYIWPNYNFFGFTRLTAQHLNTYKQIESNLSVGFGYGRYINATALAKAVRIEDHLLRDNLLTGNMPKHIMIQIANTIERENEFKDVYGLTYETYWLDEIEHVINSSELVEEDGIGSLGILRIRQVLFGINERVNDRYYGWDFAGGILFPLTTSNNTAPGDPNLTFIGRYSFPLSWKFQLNAVAESFTPLDSLAFKKYTSRLGIDFIYELSNRINFVTGYRLGLVHQPNVEIQRQQNLNTSFWYYLENNIYLTISASLTKTGNLPRSITTRIGLQYNLF